jgi:hypothetical protein
MCLPNVHTFIYNYHPVDTGNVKIAGYTASLKNCTCWLQIQHTTKKVFPKKVLGSMAIFLLLVNIALAQTIAIDTKSFFTDEQLIEMTMLSDFKALIKGKFKNDYQHHYQPATITCVFPDSSKIMETIEIRPRGNYRREECIMPPLMVNFKTTNTKTLNRLGTLKLVLPCGNGQYDEQMILKEYLVYKIYNQLTEKSFRVRLVKIGYRDVKEKIKPHTSYAFFLEDIDDLADRNGCKEIHTLRFNTEATNREQATLVTLFEYMIGNADWAIPIYRNIKMIRSKTDSLSKPFAVPYDFDYSGLVSARYAVPPLDLPINSVQQRFYLGFPRTMEELQHTLQIFRNKKNVMDSLILNLQPLEEFHKKQMIKYLDEFFNNTQKEKDIKELFINNARKE